MVHYDHVHTEQQLGFGRMWFICLWHAVLVLPQELFRSPSSHLLIHLQLFTLTVCHARHDFEWFLRFCDFYSNMHACNCANKRWNECASVFLENAHRPGKLTSSIFRNNEKFFLLCIVWPKTFWLNNKTYLNVLPRWTIKIYTSKVTSVFLSSLPWEECCSSISDLSPWLIDWLDVVIIL